MTAIIIDEVIVLAASSMEGKNVLFDVSPRLPGDEFE